MNSSKRMAKYIGISKLLTKILNPITKIRAFVLFTIICLLERKQCLHLFLKYRARGFPICFLLLVPKFKKYNLQLIKLNNCNRKCHKEFCFEIMVKNIKRCEQCKYN